MGTGLAVMRNLDRSPNHMPSSTLPCANACDCSQPPKLPFFLVLRETDNQKQL